MTAERYSWADPVTQCSFDPGNQWTFGWTHDAHGHLSSHSDPLGTISYAPNALGAPTQVSGYASAISHHPDGMVAGYTLANGIGHSLKQNLRGLPELWTHAGVIQDRYTYDANANVTAITDDLLGTHRSMPLYDGLDRLRQANGPWGAASFSYDALDNLVTSTVGARSLTHHYDASVNTGLLFPNSAGVNFPTL
jgi:hypothetical protein